MKNTSQNVKIHFVKFNKNNFPPRFLKQLTFLASIFYLEKWANFTKEEYMK